MASGMTGTSTGAVGGFFLRLGLVFHLLRHVPEFGIERVGRGLRFGNISILQCKHSGRELPQLPGEKGQVLKTRVGLYTLQQLQYGRPIACAQRHRKLRIEARVTVAGHTNVKSLRQLAACARQLGGERGGLLQLSLFHQVGDAVHEVVDVIPIVVHINMLVAHVLLIHRGRLREPLLCLRIVAHAVVDVAGHVHHVS